MFKRALSQENEKSEPSSAETEFSRAGSYRKFTRIQVRTNQHIDLVVYPAQSAQQIDGNQITQRVFRNLANHLCEKHQAISTNPKVLGGEPHIKGLRVSVAHVLAHIYHLGSIEAVVAEFNQRISSQQVKEALAYAHDFMEIACDPSANDD